MGEEGGDFDGKKALKALRKTQPYGERKKEARDVRRIREYDASRANPRKYSNPREVPYDYPGAFEGTDDELLDRNDPKRDLKGYKVLAAGGFSKKVLSKTVQKAIAYAKARDYESAAETLSSIYLEVESEPTNSVIRGKDMRDVVVNDYRKTMIAYNAANDVVRIAEENNDCNGELLNEMRSYKNNLRQMVKHPDKYAYSPSAGHKYKHLGLVGKLSAIAVFGGLIMGTILVLNGMDNYGIKLSPGIDGTNWNLWLGILCLLIGIVGASFYPGKK